MQKAGENCTYGTNKSLLYAAHMGIVDCTFILNSIRTQSCERRKFLTESVLTSFKATLSSFLPPMTFFPSSHLNSLTLPLRLMKCLRALKNDSFYIVFNVFKLMARDYRHLKIIPQHSSSLRLSFMYQGPKKSLRERRGRSKPFFRMVCHLLDLR